MIYLVALAFSVMVCAQTVAMAQVTGNIRHVRNGRTPNASVALFPMVPLYPLIELWLAWVLERFMPSVAMLVLLVIHAALFAIWTVSFRSAKAEYSRVLAESQEKSETSLNPP